MAQTLSWILIIVGAILIVFEVLLGAMSGFDFLLIGSAVVIGGILGLITGSAPVAVAAAGVRALAYVLFGRKSLRSRWRRPGILSNTDALIGRAVAVSETIAPGRPGRVKFEGEEWRAVLDEATNTWGVKVTRVEVQKIHPPSDITEAMSRQMKAERDKRALILELEGVRQSEILKAEGDAQARLTRAGAEAKAIEMVSNAAEQFFHDRAALSRQFDVLRATLAESVKYVIPANADVIAMLGLEAQTAPALVPVRRGGGAPAHGRGPGTPAPGPAA